MVNMDRVWDKVLKGAYVGAGVFASATIGNFLDDFVPGGDMGVAIGQIGVGVGVSVASERFNGGRGSMIDAQEALEFAGYGVEGAAFAELADAIQGQTGARGSRVIEVNANADGDRQAGQDARGETDEFMLENA